MNIQTGAGIALMMLGLFSPVPWGLALWFAGVAVFGYGRGVASGEREWRHLRRGGE